MIVKKYLISFLLVTHFVKAGPALVQLAINVKDKTCFSFFPGDEHVSFYLKTPENWKTFPVGFNSQVSTSFGICNYSNKEVNDCCTTLGFKLLSKSEVELLLTRRDYQDPSIVRDKSPINNQLKVFQEKNQVSTGNDKLQKSNSFLDYKNWILYFILLYTFVFLFLLFKIFKRIQNSKEKEIKNVSLKLLFLLKIYPVICVFLAIFQSYVLLKSDFEKIGILAFIYIISLDIIIVLFSTSISILVSLIGVLYQKELFFAPLLIVNLYLSFNIHVLLPKFFNSYRELAVTPKINKEKKLYSEQMKTWPKSLDISNLPKEMSLLLRDDKKVEFRNLFPIKIYLTLKAKNLSKDKPAKYDPLWEYCQLAYDVPLNSQASAIFDTKECVFQIEQRGFSIMITSDIGYSAISNQ
ncbi:MAG: hypothetical protein L6Q37_00795 [Bdellovibrionaceae bacterium]|nr:hypothetical protein [Pseudobdellovibrionaceae bacterium]NUM58934.1 hypothetical protein [Pseudobdellovibrionaceae bacterium]